MPFTILSMSGQGNGAAAGSTGLAEADLPESFRSADQSSLAAQARFLRSMRVQLVALSVAALCGAVSWTLPGSTTDIAAVVAAVAFALAGVLRARMQGNRLERTWYDGRAVAESAKTMAWRYAVAGRPFPAEIDPAKTDAAFVRGLRDLPAGLSELDVVPVSDGGRQITDAMRALRDRSLEERKTAYAEHRISDQRRWYGRKARWNKTCADRWNMVFLALDAAGAIGAAVKATSDIQIDVLPVVAAVVAGATAYVQTKQHEALASAYTVANLELASIAELLPAVADERHWARFVDEAETAISREHTMWKARRTERKTSTDEPEGDAEADEAKPVKAEADAEQA